MKRKTKLRWVASVVSPAGYHDPTEVKMKKILLLFILLILSSTTFAEPKRSMGISLHMLPERVAKLDDRPWGFWVDYAEHLQPEPGQPILQSISDYLAYIKKQTEDVQKNGVWIVTTHPDAYSENERKLLEDIKNISKGNNIILFVCRGSELPDGWQRY